MRFVTAGTTRVISPRLMTKVRPLLLERKDDLIISGGENIYPKEVENILYSHPAIDEVSAVIGVPDDNWGESVRTVVILHKGQRLTEDEVIRYCREKLASYKKPKSVEFVDDLPRNASGKVLKKKLREKYWPGEVSWVGRHRTQFLSQGIELANN